MNKKCDTPRSTLMKKNSHTAIGKCTTGVERCDTNVINYLLRMAEIINTGSDHMHGTIVLVHVYFKYTSISSRRNCMMK